MRLAAFLLYTTVWGFAALGQAPPASGPLRLEKTIPLPGLNGRLGSMAADAKTGRVFVPAVHGDAVDVVDVRQGRRVYTIKGLNRPSGLLFLPDTNRLFIANRGARQVAVLDGTTYKVLQTLAISRPPDSVAFSRPSRLLLVAHSGGVTLFDLAGKPAGEIRLESPPAMIEADPTTNRLLLNLPLNKTIAVADLAARNVMRTWPVTDQTATGQNYAFAFDYKSRRMFVATRKPAHLIILSSDSGTRLISAVRDAARKRNGVVQEADRQTVADVESVSWDAANSRIYLTGADPYIDVVTQLKSGGYSSGGRVPTAPGARTSLLLPELSRFCVAVAASDTKPAEIRVYETLK